VGRLVGIGEVVDEGLGVGHAVIDGARKGALVVRIVHVKAFEDELRVRLVLGEDDRLGKAIAAGDSLPAGHEVFEGFVDRVLIEEPGVHRRRLNAAGSVAFVVPLDGVPLVLFFFRQVIVGDALAGELDRYGHGEGRHEKAVFDRVFQGVGIGWNAAFQVKQAVGVDVDFVFGRRREAD
jgi:hypothetical protein